MYQNKKAVLIFGVGPLQESIIGRAKKMGLFTIGIDPMADATCRNVVDAFEVVGGQDFEGTCAVVEKYGIDAIVTAATDKPLVMMARVAKKYGFPFYSVETAQWSTDKFQMKQRFMEGNVPCAKGRLVMRVEETADMIYPLIVKPRDNSGSRGVKLCRLKSYSSVRSGSVYQPPNQYPSRTGSSGTGRALPIGRRKAGYSAPSSGRG